MWSGRPGRQSQESVKRESWDLIISDFPLPSFDGVLDAGVRPRLEAKPGDGVAHRFRVFPRDEMVEIRENHFGEAVRLAQPGKFTLKEVHVRQRHQSVLRTVEHDDGNLRP